MKISSRELRAGNLVNSIHGIVTIDKFVFDEIRAYVNPFNSGERLFGFLISALEPVPLTVKLLIKLGFEKDGENPDTYRIQYRYSSGFRDFIELINKGSDVEPVWFVFLSGNHTEKVWLLPIKLESVHKLQNLYFDFTDEELSFN